MTTLGLLGAAARSADAASERVALATAAVGAVTMLDRAAERVIAIDRLA